MSTKIDGKLKETLTVSLSNFLDAGAIVAGASGLTLWMTYLHLNNEIIGLLGAVSANGFGAAIGALLGGKMADKYGRKFIYKYDLLIYMLGVALISLSINFPMLLVGYILTGISVGIVVPASWSYLGEQAPENKRFANIGWGQFYWGFAPLIIFLLAFAFNHYGLLGNRIMFAILFVIALVTWILQQQIAESKLWIAEKKKNSKLKSNKSALYELFTIKANRQAFTLCAGIYITWALVAGVQGYFLPYVFEKIGHLSNTSSNLLNAFIWLLTVIFTYLVSIRKGDIWNRKLVFSISCFLEIFAWVILIFSPISWFSLIMFDVLWGISAGFSSQCFFALWSVELFKTQYRAEVQGIIFFLVRSSVGIISFFFPSMLTDLGFKNTGLILILFLIIQLIIGVIYAPETRGKSITEIEQERYGEF